MKRPPITKGKWTIREANSIYGGKLGLICAVRFSGGDNKEGNANAKAIAALPELFSALEFILGNCDPNDERHIIPKEARTAAKRALENAGYIVD